MQVSKNPYRGLDDHQFWRRAVTGMERFRFDPVVTTRFSIAASERVATAGSCFAQHISSRLAKIGFNYFVPEAGDHLTEAERRKLGYGVFSGRYGNIYTSRQLLQLFQECYEGRQPVEGLWSRDDSRFVDALRPQVTPDGYSSEEQVVAERMKHIDAVRKVFSECGVFVFTLGLTETWISRLDGTAYPLAPGVAGGNYDSSLHEFVNLSIHDVMSDMEAFLSGLKSINKDVKVILTVSPVPLIATYENRNVLVSTTYSKSVLRVAADMLYRKFEWIEYFPSYEIITGNYTNSRYYADDYRNVNKLGVDHAMSCFLRHYTTGATDTSVREGLVDDGSGFLDVVCDEEAIDQVQV